ncbi:MAG TPA: hypothetical protein VGL39_13350 [Jatrophihabitantaceae bacterium]
MISHTTSTTLSRLTVDRLLYVRIAILVLYPANLDITHRVLPVTVVNFRRKMINYAHPRMPSMMQFEGAKVALCPMRNGAVGNRRRWNRLNVPADHPTLAATHGQPA